MMVADASLTTRSPARPAYAAPLLATKLFLPPVGHRLVARQRLEEQIEHGVTAPLILVSGPAGCGKTTLLAQWIANGGLRVQDPASGMPQRVCSGNAAWISLDASDNDACRFITYLIHALQTVVAGAGAEALELLASGRLPALEPLLTILINDLCGLRTPIALVIDDYHVIRARAVHDVLTFLIDHIPGQVHLIIATRTDPPLPLARWRARGQMVEIRTRDLSFGLDEAAEFLNQVMALNLTPDAVRLLQEGTEGWIAGLQLAALSLRNRDAEGVARFIDGFSGRCNLVLDYLTDEVLRSQPEPRQDFLLRTSVLSRMCAELCDAVTASAMAGQQVLEQLEHENLFLVPLDDERRWYRYHHLFSDLLRARLQQAHPELVTTLHIQAAEWYEENGLPDDAIGHALEARDFERAARLADRNALAAFVSGEGHRLQEWFKALPAEVSHDWPWLCTYYAWVGASWGPTADLPELLADLERRLADGAGGTVDASGTRQLLAHIQALRASLATIQGDFAAALAAGMAALAGLAGAPALFQIICRYHLGIACFTKGDLAGAGRLWREVVEISDSAAKDTIVAPALARSTRAERIQGRLRQAAETCRAGLRRAEARGPARLHGAGYLYAEMAELLREQNDLEKAAAYAREAVGLFQRWPSANAFCWTHTALARVLLAQGDLDGALQVMDQEAASTRGLGVFYDLRSEATACRLALLRRQGDLEAWLRWAAGSGLGVDDELTFMREVDHVTLARGLLAQGQAAAASQLLARLAREAEAGGRTGRLIEILVLAALADAARATGATAAHHLLKASTLAEPEGYRRVFLDEGSALRETLVASRRLAACLPPSPDTPRLVAYIDGLLAELPDPSDSGQDVYQLAGCPPGGDVYDHPGRGHTKTRQAPTVGPYPITGAGLVEPLTGRELEVLELLAAGLSNRAIADRLCISLNTLQRHTSNLYGKLGVHSRMQAVLAARQLGLLAG